MVLPLIVFIRGTLAFIMLLILTRLMGKRQVSQLTFFDYVNGITIGSIAASMTTDATLELGASTVGLLTWSFWVLVVAIVNVYSRRARKLIDGEPTIVVQNGKILERNLKQLGYNLDDMRMQLRQMGAFNLADVEFALLEPNGKLSVLKKSQKQALTPSDMKIPTEYMGLPTELITDGKVVEYNLKQLNLDRTWLERKLKERELKLKDIFYAELDTSGNLFVDILGDFGTVAVKDITEA